MHTTAKHTDSFPVVVIGAGLAGLTAAIHLAERGIAPLVLEADLEWPGGRLAGGPADSFEYAGRRWSFESEHGIHALWGNYDNTRAMLERFVPIDLVESAGEEWITRWDRRVWITEAGTAVRKTWLPAPFHYMQLLLRPGFWKTITLTDVFAFPAFLVSILLTVGVDPIGEGIAWDGLLMEDYFFGWTPVLRSTFKGLGRNLLAAPAEECTLAGFIAALRFFTMLRRDSWRLQYFPDNPHRCLVGPLIAQIEARGGMVISGARVQSLEREGDRWRVIVEDARRGMRSVLAEQVILAVDAPAAERILKNTPHTAEAAQAIRFPAALRNVTVRLWFDAQPRAGTAGGMFTGDFTADNFFWLHRIRREFQAWQEASGGSAIEMHLYAPEDLLDNADAYLLTLATTDILRAFPELRGHFVYGSVRRNEATQTRFRVPTAESLQIETPWPGISACGDWVGYPNPAMWIERCCVTGIAAANHVLEGAGLEPFPIVPPRRPEVLARAIGRVVRGLRRALGPAARGIVQLVRKPREGGR